MKQHGFSLVELMISMVLGMIVIASTIAIYSSTYGANSSQMKMSRLNNELRMVMTQVTRDLRRASGNNWMGTIGTMSGTSITSINYLAANPISAPVITSHTATIPYDLNSSGGTAGSDELFEYQWTGNKIQTRIGAGSWTDLTDSNAVNITDFNITNISPAAIAASGAVATVTVPVYSVSITGQLVQDATVQRTLRETVRLRNSLYN